jgi:hypothetical protein
VTREHLYFVPIIFALGLVLGSLLTWHRLRRIFPRHFADAPNAPRRTTARSLWVPLGLFLLLFAATHALGTHGGARAVEEALGGRPIFDQRPSFSVDEVYARIEAFGAAGRAAYQRMTFTSDLVFPLALFAFLLQLTRYVSERVPTLSPLAKKGLLLVPLAWLLADFAENWTVFQLLEHFPARDDTLASRLGVVTHVKFGLLLASVASPAALSLLSRPDVHPAAGQPGP